ncbi:AraC family transcriptional regulator [Inconstantimicrobium mannanitabidum]|uniref:AraC family transcriptional regulator n=1 Tax=Inconstantimicrobium mannanitabidum TaxID=1604901 RepID=A0ACB5R9Q6_9CLOT|nr:AraC family transcriptional regulator [Clostridium sp. TW13]GKX65765.1 AraC family transcriptional regulator [Clostridium sp. TW13]
MDFKHEMIQFNDDIPIKLYNGKVLSKEDPNHINTITKHWHSNIEIFYIITGSIDLWVNSEKYELGHDNLMAININEIHSSQYKQNGEGVLLQIPYEFVKIYYPNIDGISFVCNSTLKSEDGNKYSKLKGMLKDLECIYNERKDGYILKSYSLIFDILFELVTNFSISKPDKESISSRKNLDRLTEIVDYIKDNKKLDLSLEMVAEKVNLTPQYFSKFFKKYMGISYIKYLNSLRLESAYRELINTDLSIINIAIENGFSDVKAFNKLFKNVYGSNPGEYRKNKKG